MKGKRLVIVLCVLTAVGRIFIVPIIKLSWTDAYIASAHMLAGFLIGVRFYNWHGEDGTDTSLLVARLGTRIL